MSNFYASLAPAQLQQDINPWTWVNPFAHSQIGWVNINLGKSSDPALERRILDDVGSYGRQIGQLGDALEAVLNHLPVAEWKPEAQEAVAAFRYQLREVRRLKKAHRGGAAA
ncbi:hypothetical protein [Pseudorhodoferax sp. Leaf265]|jgi:hypothetical protein|uniref:hypothetical protein n=1 Tax=unclassified Pseudorhodoferax TaxID=2638544 RepID=UPI0006F52A01|nr:hypothetical protein [Pseudorhodoferax sp. Leaf265]KQP17096.1 hypothetical protein ASF45_28205 [Pseudorhodoferax sp. Leaf265]PZQ00650.1 MAG: hypothetical protein DI583_07570 [Variovorax paradoxus]PZQ13381.1 MAG: hypothetical protein DI587_07570 [Variovorax paradoxus]